MMRILVLFAVVGFAACQRDGPIIYEGVGGICGGFTVQRHECKPGLVCIPDPRSNMIADLPGKCAYPKQAGLGEQCGGFRINPIQCKAGLECQPDPKIPGSIIADAPGICGYPKSGLNGPCGGNTHRTCKDGLRCQASSYPGQPGKCVRGISNGGLGDPCGGIAGFRCQANLVCKITDNFPDAMGVCVRPGSNGGLGDPCGGIAGFQCQKQYVCKITDNFPDAMGTCVLPTTPGGRGGLGDPCGGFAGLRCQANLDCKITANFPDATGVCVLPKSCIIHSQCPLGYSCIPRPGYGLAGHCERTICWNGVRNCPRGFQCDAVKNSAPVCVAPTCTNEQQCPKGYNCILVGPVSPTKPKTCIKEGTIVPF